MKLTAPLTAPRLRAVTLSTLALAALVATSAAPVSAAPALAPAAPMTAATLTAAVDSSLRVASYNVRSMHADAKIANGGTWEQRRSSVVSTIKAENLDVLGVQEASQSALYAGGKKLNLSQFQDLTARLGSPWKLTSTSRYNCANDTTPYKCKVVDRGSSSSLRILYNSNRVRLVKAGAKALPSTDRDHLRYVTWARFEQLSTGRDFMFSNTHLESGKGSALYAMRKRQAQAALKVVQQANTAKLPVIAVGDLNSNKWASPSNAPYDVYLKAGFKDPLGNAARTTKTAKNATVKKRVRTWLNSANGFERKARGNYGSTNGVYIDYILTTPMRVDEWETVAKLDAKRHFVGRIPSDHNLIRATVHLPGS